MRSAGTSAGWFDQAVGEHLLDGVSQEVEVLRYLVRQTLDPEVAFDLAAGTFAEALDGIALFAVAMMRLVGRGCSRSPHTS